MHFPEAAVILGPSLAFGIFLPWIYYRKLAKQQWISTFCSELSKEWHMPNKAYVAHVRSQARTDILRVFQQEGIQTFNVEALDELNNRLTNMEEKVENLVQPIFSTWLCLLVVLEALQFLAVPFASKVKWDTKTDWKVIPNVLGCFLPDPTKGGVYEITTWVVLVFLYLAAFCALWIIILGAITRWLPCLKRSELQEYLGNIFFKLLWLFRGVLISSKELVIDFGTLFIFTTIIQSCLNQDGSLTFYWPSSILTLCIFYSITIFSDQIIYSAEWISYLLNIFAFDKALTDFFTMPKDDHHYFKSQTRFSKEKELRTLRIHFFGHQRPVLASRWTLLSATFKLLLGVLYTFGHFDGPWAWILLAFSTIGFFVLLHDNIKYGPCTIHWVNICRTIGLLISLWGNACAFLAQGLNANPNLTYPYTPTIVFLCGLVVILLSIPFCFVLSLRLFTCSPIRLHPLKLQVIHAYYKFVALGRINSVKDTFSMERDATDGCNEIRDLLHHIKFQHLLNNEHKYSSKKLAINNELWVIWIRKNTQFFGKKHLELSMQDEIRACSKKRLDCEEYVSEDHEHLKTAQKIKDWMKDADMVIDPKRDIELGLHVPYDEYLTFSDGAPIFTNDPGQRVFPERSLRRVTIQGKEDFVVSKDSTLVEEMVEGEGSGIPKSPPFQFSSNPLTSAGTIKEQTSLTSSHPFIRTPCQDLMEKPNKVGSLGESTSVVSAALSINASSQHSQLGR